MSAKLFNTNIAKLYVQYWICTYEYHIMND